MTGDTELRVAEPMEHEYCRPILHQGSEQRKEQGRGDHPASRFLESSTHFPLGILGLQRRWAPGVTEVSSRPLAQIGWPGKGACAARWQWPVGISIPRGLAWSPPRYRSTGSNEEARHAPPTEA